MKCALVIDNLRLPLSEQDMMHLLRIAGVRTYDDFQCAQAERALSQGRGRVDRAAELMGVTREHMHRIIKAHSLKEQ